MTSLIALWLGGFFVLLAVISLGCRLTNHLEFTKDWKVIRDLIGFFMVDMPALLLVLVCTALTLAAAATFLMRIFS